MFLRTIRFDPKICPRYREYFPATEVKQFAHASKPAELPGKYTGTIAPDSCIRQGHCVCPISSSFSFRASLLNVSNGRFMNSDIRRYSSVYARKNALRLSSSLP